MQPLVQTIQRDSAITFPMFGNLTINPPSYFTVFGMDIYFYGVIIGLGFILGILYCSHNSRRFGIDQDSVYDVMIWLIPTAIIGARLYYVLFRLDYYVQHPNEIFAIHNGGLAIYGGVIAGVLVIWLVCRKKKIPLGAMLDLGRGSGPMNHMFARRNATPPSDSTHRSAHAGRSIGCESITESTVTRMTCGAIISTTVSSSPRRPVSRSKDLGSAGLIGSSRSLR